MNEHFMFPPKTITINQYVWLHSYMSVAKPIGRESPIEFADRVVDEFNKKFPQEAYSINGI